MVALNVLAPIHQYPDHCIHKSDDHAQPSHQIQFILIVSIAVGVAHGAESVSVYVSIAPRKYFVQQIGKDLVDDRLKKMLADPLAEQWAVNQIKVADQFKTALQ